MKPSSHFMNSLLWPASLWGHRPQELENLEYGVWKEDLMLFSASLPPGAGTRRNPTGNIVVGANFRPQSHTSAFYLLNTHRVLRVMLGNLL